MMSESSLHILSQSPAQMAASHWPAAVSNHDGILLLADALWYLCHWEETTERFSAQPQLRWYALAPDLAARGLSGRIPEAAIQVVEQIDYAQMVDLCAHFNRSISW